MGRGAIGSLLKGQECAQIFSDHGIASERITAKPKTNLDQQFHWCIITKGGRGGRAFCLLFEQVAPKSRDELSFDRAPSPRAQFCDTKASPLFPFSFAQLGDQVGSPKVSFIKTSPIKTNCSMASPI